jgi:hypothetical protein
MFRVRATIITPKPLKKGSMSNKVDRRWPDWSSRAGIVPRGHIREKISTGKIKRLAQNAQV